MKIDRREIGCEDVDWIRVDVLYKAMNIPFREM